MRISDCSSDVCSSDLLGDDLWPIDERRHRIDEEDAGQAVIVEHVHLEMDAEIAIVAAAEDRAVEIGARVDAPPVKAGGKPGVETDRKSVVEGKSVSVRVDLGGARHIKKKQIHK